MCKIFHHLYRSAYQIISSIVSPSIFLSDYGSPWKTRQCSWTNLFNHPLRTVCCVFSALFFSGMCVFSSRRLSVTVCPTTASSAFIIWMVQFSHKVQTIKRFSLKLNKYLCLKSREKRYWSLISLACSNTAVILFSSWFVFYVKL